MGLCALGALIPFVTILFFGIPGWFPGWITEDTTSVLPPGAGGGQMLRLLWTGCGCVLTIGLMRLPGLAGRFLPLAVLLSALAVAQAWLWQSGVSKYVLLGGWIPFSDAAVYTEYANHIVQNHQVGYSLQDRPMFPAYLASLLRACGRDPQLALSVILLMAGVSMHLAARAVRIAFGGLVAGVFLSVVLLYYSRWIGTTMTEHLGLTLSLLACPLLIAGFLEKREGQWIAGIALLTFALCARAGAFFVLPCLCALTALHFRDSQRFAWKLSAQSLCAVFAAMALSRFLAFCVFDADHFPRSNFDYTAYGVVYQKDWSAALAKYGTNHDKIRAAVIKKIKTHPASIVTGSWRAWRMFFADSAGFQFMGRWCSILFQSLTICAFIMACLRRAPAHSFVIAVCIGVGSSIPFAPPWDADTMRVYAATIPLHALLAGLGARAVFLALKKPHSTNAEIHEPMDSETAAASVFGVMILTLVFVVPITRFVYFPSRSPMQRVEDFAAHPGTIVSGSYINLVPDDTVPTRRPEVRLSDFRSGLANMSVVFQKQTAALSQLPPGVSIVSGGFDIGILPTVKLKDPASSAVVKKVDLAGMNLVVDEDLPLPFLKSP